jgi:hypothetical protein
MKLYSFQRISNGKPIYRQNLMIRHRLLLFDQIGLVKALIYLKLLQAALYFH